ncbi:MAG: sulfurtransferase, partial [Deltaproteobacteria bacterium HGW-Deltaproteobacteria-20]
MMPLLPSPWIAYALAVISGFFFGFVLERAGFGNSRKLAAQFYFKDMTVLK